MAQSIVNIDISDVREKIEAISAVHTTENLQKLVYFAFDRTASKVKTIIKKRVPEKYCVEEAYVGRFVGKPNMKMGGTGGVSCSIPVEGGRGHIGGAFSAKGGVRGWKNVRHLKRGKIKVKRYKITASIVKGKTSTLPTEMSSYGGGAPFRNTSAKKLNGLAYTRQKGEKEVPIRSILGVAVPQMVANRAAASIQDEILPFLIKRLEHEHAQMIKRCR